MLRPPHLSDPIAFWNNPSVIEDFSAEEEKYRGGTILTPEQKQSFFNRLMVAGDVSSGSMIDFGCGLSRILDFLPRERVAPYVGLDCSKDLLALAAKRYPDTRFVHGAIVDAASLLGEQKFDFFVARNSLHFIEPDEMPASLASMRSCVRTGAGGYVLMFEGKGSGVVVNHGDDLTAAYEWPTELLIELLERSGFEIHSQRYEPLKTGRDIALFIRAV